VEKIQSFLSILTMIGVLATAILAFVKGKKVKGLKFPTFEFKISKESEPLNVKMCDEDRKKIDTAIASFQTIAAEMNKKDGINGPPVSNPPPLEQA